jgi:hypothetical protein
MAGIAESMPHGTEPIHRERPEMNDQVQELLYQALETEIGGHADPADDATIVAKKASGPVTTRFTAAMARHRLWSREPEVHLPL